MLDVIRDRTCGLLDNLRRVISTADLNHTLYQQPLWKHIYHALYWFDYWYCTPESYIGAPFHCRDLENLDVQSKICLSKKDLEEYLTRIEKKTLSYLDTITEAALSEIPENCGDKTRFACILGQFIHVYTHLGNINAVTIQETGKWPFVAIRAKDQDKPLFE